MKLRTATLTVLSLFIVSAAYAGFGDIGGGNIGKGLGKTVDSVASSAIIDDLNKQIAAKNCRYKNKTTEHELTCSLNSIASLISKKKSVLENAFGKRIRIDIKAMADKRTLANERARNAYDVLYGTVSWWRMNRRGVAGGDGLDIVVSKY